jgi:hypothetical protein
MNRINPLYLIALTFTVLFISFYLLNNEKNLFTEKKNELVLIKQKAKDFKSYNKSWNNESFINKTLDNILRSRQFLNQKVLRAKTKNSIKVKIQSTNQNILNTFLNKILNKKLSIKKLQIEKNFVNVEIGIR